MSSAARSALKKLIKSGDLPKTRAEFLDGIETGGDTAKVAFIESLDKLDPDARAALGSMMQGGEEPWEGIANAAYGAEPARKGNIRGKKQQATEEVIERPGPTGDKGTLPAIPKGKGASKPAAALKGPGNRGGKAAAAKPAGKGAATQPNPLAPMETNVGTFVPAERFQEFAEAAPPEPPAEPDLGGVTYSQTGLAPADPTGSAMVGYEGPPTFQADTMGYEPPPPPNPMAVADAAVMANPALAGLLDGGPMPGNFVDDLSPSFNSSQDMLPSGVPPEALMQQSMMPQEKTFQTDTSLGQFRQNLPFDVSRMNSRDYPPLGDNPDPFSSTGQYTFPGSSQDWQSVLGSPNQFRSVLPGVSGADQADVLGRPSQPQQPAPPQSMQSKFWGSRWPYVLGGIGGIGGLTVAANYYGAPAQPGAVQSDTSPEAMAAAQAELEMAKSALFSPASGAAR